MGRWVLKSAASPLADHNTTRLLCVGLFDSTTRCGFHSIFIGRNAWGGSHKLPGGNLSRSGSQSKQQSSSAAVARAQRGPPRFDEMVLDTGAREDLRRDYRGGALYDATNHNSEPFMPPSGVVNLPYMSNGNRGVHYQVNLALRSPDLDATTAATKLGGCHCAGNVNRLACRVARVRERSPLNG